LQSAQEEIANSIVHGIALVASVASVPCLLQLTGDMSERNAYRGGSLVFAITMVLLYLCSTLYHALPEGRARLIFLRLDHGAIYLFIAGSFTPFALVTLDAASGGTVLALVWMFAAVGFVLKASGRLSHPHISTALYVLMGWSVLITALPMIQRLPQSGQLWLVMGGVAYTAGVIFFLLDARMRYAHAIWHCFVVAGTSCHFVAVLRLNH
jgi:hemolysin III